MTLYKFQDIARDFAITNRWVITRDDRELRIVGHGRIWVRLMSPGGRITRERIETIKAAY